RSPRARRALPRRPGPRRRLERRGPRRPRRRRLLALRQQRSLRALRGVSDAGRCGQSRLRQLPPNHRRRAARRLRRRSPSVLGRPSMKHERGWARLWAVVRRRRWAVIGTTIAAGAVGFYVVDSMEPQYQARSVVRVDDPHVAREYVPPLVNEPDGERLKSARMGFLAQPLIAEAAQKAGLLPSGDDQARALALARATQHIDAHQEGQDTFIVTYEDSDPARARTLRSTLVTKYIQLRTAGAATRSAQTAAVLSKEIEALRPRVAAADAALEKVRLEHYGALPDQMEANLRQLDDNQLTVHALMASLDAAEGRRRDILMDVQSPLRHQE